MLEKINKYGKLNSHDTTKFLALLAMIIDHIGCYLIPQSHIYRVVGRIAMPLFLFLVGYTHNKDKKTKYNIIFYGILLFIFSYLISSWKTGNFFNFNEIFSVNILITIFITRYVLDIIEDYTKNIYSLISLTILFIPLYLFTRIVFDYGTLAFLFAISGKIIKSSYFKNSINYIFTGFVIALYVCIQSLVFQFSKVEIIIFLMLMIYIFYYVCTYNFRIIEVQNPKVDYIIKFISRYSLQIYFWHVLLLRLW